jgi:hypothetical protein
MIRHETFKDGKSVDAIVLDPVRLSIAFEENGKVVTSRPMTADEVAAYLPTVSDPVAALAALLVDEGVVTAAQVVEVLGEQPV